MSKRELSNLSADTEKNEAAFISEVAVADFAEINERRLLRKIDFRIVPWMSFLSLLNTLDRTNIGNARVRACCLVLLQVSITDVSAALWHGGRPTHDGQAILDRLDSLFLPVRFIRAPKQHPA